MRAVVGKVYTSKPFDVLNAILIMLIGRLGLQAIKNVFSVSVKFKNMFKKIVVTFGTYDVFYIGHVNVLERAKELGDYLIVCVSSDALNLSKKGRYPVYKELDRLNIVNAIRCVDEVFVEESL